MNFKKALGIIENVANTLDKSGAFLFSRRLDKVLHSLASDDYVNLDFLYKYPNIPTEEDFSDLEAYHEALSKFLDKEVDKEDRVKLVNFLYPYDTKAKHIILDKGKIPFAKNSPYDVYLGSGANSQVYNIIHEDKEAAWKLSNSDTEYIIWTYIESIKPKLSDTAKSILPKIYEFDKNTLTVTVEKLAPLSKLHYSLFRGPTINNLPKLFSKSELREMMVNSESFNVFSDVEIEAIIEYIKSHYTFNINPILGKKIVKLHPALYTISFPNHIEKSYVYPKGKYPELEKLYAALKELESFGIEYADLHSGNVMERKSTGDLVIIDVDSFEINRSKLYEALKATANVTNTTVKNVKRPIKLNKPQINLDHLPNETDDEYNVRIDKELAYQDKVKGLDQDEIDLLQLGITPIKAPQLGEGTYGRVLPTELEGKDVATKITQEDLFYDDPINEYAVYKDIEEVKNKLSPEAQRHLPKIYKLENKNGKHIIVMEKLKPLDDLNKRILFGVTSNKEEKLNNISDKAFKYMDSLRSKDLDLKDKTFKEAIDYLFRRGLYYPNVNKYTIEQLNKLFVLDDISDPEYLYRKFISNDERDKVPFEYVKTIYAIVHDIWKFFKKKLYAKVPARFIENEYFDENVGVLKDSPEFKSFINALKELASNGIRYKDLHGENVMVRPGTNDLVLVDVAMYSTPNNRSTEELYEERLNRK